MNRNSWPTAFTLIAILIAAVLSTASAQAQTRETGSVTAQIDGATHSFVSSAKHVPEDVAEGVTDEKVRAILEKVAGTDQHTATYMVMDPIMVGEVEIVPATLYATLGTAWSPEGASEEVSFDVKFSLDPAALDPASIGDIEVLYYPNGWNFDDYYALTEGGLTLDSVVVVDDTTVAVSGTIDGVLTHQTTSTVEHNPADTLPITASFTIDEVVGSQLALDLITGE